MFLLDNLHHQQITFSEDIFIDVSATCSNPEQFDAQSWGKELVNIYLNDKMDDKCSKIVNVTKITEVDDPSIPSDFRIGMKGLYL